MRNPLAHTLGRGNTVERGFALREYTPDPRLYEMMTILSPDVSEDDLPAQIEAIAGYITTAGGTVNETLRESPWGRRRLAYSIRHTGRDIRDGFYTVFHFTLDPSGVRDIERDLKLNDQVMRFLITHYSPKTVVPGAATEGGEEVPTDAEAAPAPAADEATGAPAAAAAAAEAEAEAVTETPGEAVEAATADAAAAAVAETEAEAQAEAGSPEATEPTEAVAEVAAPAETSDTEAAVATSEPAEADVEASTEIPVSVEATEVETPPTDETPAVDEAPPADEIPAEPAAPAKDDEEA